MAKTTHVDHLRTNCVEIGDSLKSTYEKTKDLKAAKGSVGAYGKAIQAMKLQLVYKRLTGSPAEIDFLK